MFSSILLVFHSLVLLWIVSNRQGAVSSNLLLVRNDVKKTNQDMLLRVRGSLDDDPYKTP